MTRTSTRTTVATVFNLLVLCAMAVLALPIDTHAATTMAELQATLKANYPDGLPRYLTPEEKQWLDQQAALKALEAPGLPEELPPPAPLPGTVYTPAEYEAVYGPIVAWEGASAAQQAILTDFIVGITTDATMNSLVFVGVADAAQQATCTTTLTTHSPAADMDRVRFFYYNFDSLWICDYGPRSVLQNGSTSAVIDHKYNRVRASDDAYPAFSVTNAIPYPQVEPLANLGGTSDATSIIHGGGNFLSFSNGDGFASDLIVSENPTRTQAQIVADFLSHFNVNLTIFPRLLSTMDSTGHIDMWFMPVGNNKVVIAQFPASNYSDSKAKTDAAAAAMAARGYTVYRTPSWSSTNNETGGGTHFTYTNIAIINKKVFVPTYNHANDAGALATYASAMPGYTIVPLDCSGTISLAGAIHCIVKHVYVPVSPYGEIIKPNGGEVMTAGQPYQIKWIANGNTAISNVDLYYSIDNGSTWTTIATGEPHDGLYTWTAPNVNSNQCLVRTVVHDSGGNTYTDNSNANFTISPVGIVGTATTNTSASARTSATFSHTVAAGNNRLLAVSVMLRGNITASSVTYGGTALTRAISRASGASSGCTTEIWYLVAPAVGTANVVATFSASAAPSAIAAVNITGVDQSSPVGATASALATSGTNITTSITTLNANSLIFGAATNYGGDTDPFTPGTNITELWDNATGTSTSADNGQWGGYRLAATAGAYTFNTTSAASDDWTIAAAEIKAAPVILPPGAATAPSPAHTATNVGVTTDLGWSGGSGATSHDVYFGTSATPAFIGNQAAATYDTGTMANNTTYYWRIDEKNVGGTTTGTVWSFSTNASVPGVVGGTQAAATTAINGAGLVVGTVTQAYSDTVAAGNVISQNPVGGTAVNVGSSVNMVVSLGLPVIPNVVGQAQAAAESAITAASFTVGTVTTAHSDTVAAGNVISQSPVGGTAATSGTAVNLVVSLGLPVIPNVVGQAQAAAEAAITAASFTVGTVTTAHSDTVAAGNVISQSPVGGTAATSGTAVNMVVSLGLPVIPNVVGQAQAAAESAITAASFTVGTVTTAHSDTVAAGNVISQSKVGAATSGTAVDLVVSLGLPIIPDVTGQAQAAAEAAITAASFTVGTVTTAHSDTVAAGNVISQSPVGGTAATSGTAVSIVVSLGLPIIPDVTGQAQAAAEAAITAATFTVGTVTTAHSDTVAAGNVISQSPVGGTAATSGTAVSIVVSLGLPVVPDVTGQAQAAAESAITAASFTVGTVTTAHSDTVAAGNVISQNPTSGTAIASGTAVNLVVSLGLPVIPNVVGQAQAAAEAAITAATFTVGTVTTAHSDTVAAGNVISQSPVGGTAATSGTAVSIVVSLGLPIIPDVTGQAQAAAEAAITAATFTVGTVTTAHSDTVAAGNVISQSPVGGTAATSGTAVNLVVSLGLPVIPNVVGQAQAAAEAAITAASFTVGTVTTAHSDTVAAGNVISQNPTSGTAIASGTAVNLVVSLGLPVIPNVVGQAQAAAEAAITAATFTVGTVTTAHSDTVAAGNVISQSPVGGTAIASGTAVNMVVSLGLPVIPNVVGQVQAAAEAAITAASFTVGTVTTAHSDTVAAGNVISQSPVGGTAATSGTAVNLVVSLGLPVIPNVVGQAQAAAEAAITAASFTVGTVTTAHSDTVAAGNVISQNPTSGTAIASGTAVNIVVSLGLPVVPDVTGQAQAAAEAAITAASFTVGTVTTAHSDTVAAGNVISQSPVGGTAATSGTAVSIVVSLGLPVIPDVTGQAQAAAEAAITAATFTVGTVTTAHSDTVAAGNVISQSPVGGTAIASGTAVSIVVSLGLPVVPDVTGQAQAAAEAAITAASFTVGTVTTAHSDTVAAGNVISQSPVGGTVATSGTAVSIVVSLGLPVVPDVTGQAQAAAEAAITAASFTVGTVTTAHSDTVAAGNVISQSPAGGTAIASGTAVNIVVSLGASPRIISGYVRQPDGVTPVSDVVIDANNGGGISGITDANGYYHVAVPYGWSGNVTPVKEGYTFEPGMTSYSNVVADGAADYTARLVTYRISGRIAEAGGAPISDVNVVADSGGGAWTTKYGGGSCLTGPDGRYSITVDYNWSGKVTPAKYAYAFVPESTTYANVVADQNDQDYIGRLMTFAIGGHVLNQCGLPIAGVTVSADNGGGLATTDAGGYYEVWVSYNWSGTVTCAKVYYGFTPAGMTYTGVLGNYMAQNYQAVDAYDLDCNGAIGMGDVAVFSEYWLSAGPVADMDGNGSVNFVDFAMFTLRW